MGGKSTGEENGVNKGLSIRRCIPGEEPYLKKLSMKKNGVEATRFGADAEAAGELIGSIAKRS